MPVKNAFLRIAVTLPFFIEEESSKIVALLKNMDADFIHIRKPGAFISQIDNLISEIPPVYHKYLKLHDHYALINKYELGGIHLNSRNPYPLTKKGLTISKSAHSYTELINNEEFEYIFLSPIFDSISKPAYKSNFKEVDLKNYLINKKNIIALGGVSPDKFSYLKELGFAGAAMLGYFWK